MQPEEIVALATMVLLPAVLYWLAAKRVERVSGPVTTLLLVLSGAAPTYVLWVHPGPFGWGPVLALALLCFAASAGMLFSVMYTLERPQSDKLAGFNLWLVEVLSRIVVVFIIPLSVLWLALIGINYTGQSRLLEHPGIAFLIGLAFMALMTVLMPWLYRLLWGGRSLADPAIRQMVGELERQTGVRVLDVLVLPDRNRGPGTAVADGLTMARGWIYLPERYLQVFTPQELRAVLAHEVAHLRLAHGWLREAVKMIWVGGFILTILLLRPHFPVVVQSPVLFALACGLNGLGLSLLTAFISRRMEFAADRLAVQLLGDSRPLISALETTRQVFGEDSTLSWWRLSPPIQDRIAAARKVQP